MTSASDFQRLIEAYGADPRRWPADRRAGAQAFMVAAPEETAAILALEAALDEAMDLLRPPVASAALRQRIAATAPQAREEGWAGLFTWLRPSVGAAMVASCAAGAVAGLLLVHSPERGDAGPRDLWASVSSQGDTAAADDDSELS